ncbi:MAG TPA: SpoIVB peptidase S55 domain-containing protein, partial [Candidatus Glassbacteria bacterium]|nr:SpoIVB peptidase S55 domain-containing protein [Candidatus Glassbacteria bacterium]
MRPLILTCVSIFILIFGAGRTTAGEVPIMPVDQVKSGMDGYGLTVFSGDSIERFEVRIIGTVKNFLPKKDVILAELQGERLRYTGVIGGMSGSPIYIDGKLIGALAYGWQFAKDPIVGITPIEQMLEIEKVSAAWGAAAPQGGGAPDARTPAAVYNPLEAPPNPLLDDSAQDESAAGAGSFAAGGASLARLEVPLIYSGFHPEVIERYGKAFGRFGLVPIAGGSSGGSQTGTAEVAPGSAVSAQL